MIKVVKKEGLLKRIIKEQFKRELWVNKMFAFMLMLTGYCTEMCRTDLSWIFELTLIIGIPIFIAKRNVIK